MKPDSKSNHTITFTCSEHGEQSLYRLLFRGLELTCHCWWQLSGEGEFLWKGQRNQPTKTWTDLQKSDSGAGL
jgi:hypothetical protein